MLVIAVLASHVVWPVHTYAGHVDDQHTGYPMSFESAPSHQQDGSADPDHCGHLSAHVVGFVVLSADIMRLLAPPTSVSNGRTPRSQSTTPLDHPPKP